MAFEKQKSVYEIADEMTSLTDPETGELLDYERFVELQMSMDDKIANMRNWYLDNDARIAALNAEKKHITSRIDDEIDMLAKRNERLAEYLTFATAGEKVKTDRYSISRRKSEATELDDSFIEWAKVNAPDLLKYSEPTAKKADIKAALKDGRELDHARLVVKDNIVVR